MTLAVQETLIDAIRWFDEAGRLPNPFDVLTICSSLVTAMTEATEDRSSRKNNTNVVVRLAH